MINEIISLFYPQLCAACKKPVHKSDWAICLNCRIKFPRTKFLFMEKNPIISLLEGKCNVEHAFAYYTFEKSSALQKAIHALKYKGVQKVGEEFGQIIGSDLKKSDLYNNIDFIVALPLHKSKKRIRGYNQCDSIAKGIASAIDAELNLEIVHRIRATESQTKKSHYDRHTNAEQIFKVKNPEKFSNKKVLLIDDVITTGSTLASLIRELNKIENCTVYAGTIAVAR